MDKKRVSVVTGGTSGIGRGIAEKILKHSSEGDLVFVNYAHNEERAKAFADSLPAPLKTRVELVKADMSSYEDMMRFVQVIKDRAGSVDWLVCNAGISTYAKYEDYTFEECGNRLPQPLRGETEGRAGGAYLAAGKERAGFLPCKSLSYGT